MDYFRVSEFNGYTGPMYGVEFTQNDGGSWTTMSVHSTPEIAEREMRSYVALHRDECAFWEEALEIGLNNLKNAFREINKWEADRIMAELGDETFEVSPGFEENTLKECLAILNQKKKC